MKRARRRSTTTPIGGRGSIDKTSSDPHAKKDRQDEYRGPSPTLEKNAQGGFGCRLGFVANGSLLAGRGFSLANETVRPLFAGRSSQFAARMTDMSEGKRTGAFVIKATSASGQVMWLSPSRAGNHRVFGPHEKAEVFSDRSQ